MRLPHLKGSPSGEPDASVSGSEGPLTGGPMVKLLKSLEWEDLKERVIIEGAFVEVDESETAIELYYIAITENYLFLARREVLSYKEDPRAYSPRVDADSYGLTIKAMISLRQLHLSAEPEKFLMLLDPDQRPRRRFFLCTTANIFDRFEKWFNWIDQINELRDSDSPINVLKKPSSMRAALPQNIYCEDKGKCLQQLSQQYAKKSRSRLKAKK